MDAISIDIDQLSNRFVLDDKSGNVSRNKRANHFFRQFLHASFLEDGQIIINYSSEDNPNLLLKKIHDALTKYGLEQTDSSSVKEVLQSYFQDRQDFAEFSRKARGIWHNEIDSIDLDKFTASVQSRLPNRTLYWKQLLAAFHLAFSQNACNFSVPGAGKTSMVYAAYAYLNSLSPSDPKYVNKLLVIGPLSSFGPWEDEFVECFGRRVNSKRLSGGVSKAEKDAHFLSVESIDDTPELTLISYQGIATSFENLKQYLTRSGNNVMVVLDEAHRIKNVDGGIWANAVLRLATYCKARIVLTGTPIPNGYEDIFNLYEFIWPEKDIINFNVFQLKDMSANRFDRRVDKLITGLELRF